MDRRRAGGGRGLDRARHPDGMPDRSHADARPTAGPVADALARYERPLLAYAARLTGDAERARDVVQETFLRLCARGEPESAEWLYTVCRNLALDVRRKERPMVTTSEGAVLDRASGEPGPDGEAERRDSVSRVLRVLAGLPENQREVLRLKFQHGLSYREIAGVTELSVSNVGFLIHRGLKSLRERLVPGESDLDGVGTSSSGGVR
jgi:RNA polymerase sigma-70 factor (ECF subfamily)